MVVKAAPVSHKRKKAMFRTAKAEQKPPMTIGKKLWMGLALMWVGMIAIVFSLALQSRTQMFDERKESLSNVVHLATGIVQEYAARVETGELTKAEAEQRAFDMINSIRFGADNKNYVFSFDSQAHILNHPRRERGTDMSTYKDDNGTAVYQELVSEAKRNGAGFVEYVSRAAEGDAIYPKLSYVSLFAPWDAYFSAGVYVNDITSAFIDNLIRYCLLLLAVGGIVTVVMALLIRNISRSLGGEPFEANRIVGRIAEGDLGVHIPLTKNDQSSLMFNIAQMRDSLIETVFTIRQASESIDVGAREIAAGNNDLSSRTEQQAASLEQTAASMEQLTATVRQNGDNARQASHLAAQASTTSSQGRDVVQRVVKTMSNITTSSRKIEDIISLIDGIAFQTNLLALNAAVEAARAGEQGRGFAVVAGEVRSLASRSADAAKEIKALIAASASQVEAGSALVDEADSTMQEVLSHVQRVSDLMSEISAASAEQTTGIEQVNEAVTQMDQVTQQNAALVEEAAAAAGSLEDQSRHLRETVGRFKLDAEDSVTA